MRQTIECEEKVTDSEQFAPTLDRMVAWVKARAQAFLADRRWKILEDLVVTNHESGDHAVLTARLVLSTEEGHRPAPGW